jgi:hypothetical protein
MFQRHFSRKDYVALYLHAFGDGFADALFYLFSGAYLYTIGVPLHFVILFFGLEFGLRGMLSPVGLALAGRWGIGRTILLSYASLLCFFIAISQASQWIMVGFFSFIFFSFARALYYPCIDGLHAIAVDDADRGRQQTMEMTFITFAELIGVAVGAYVLSQYSYGHLVLIAAGVLVCSVLPLFFILDRIPVEKVGVQQSFSYIISPESRKNYPGLAGLAFSIIAAYVCIPLMLFILAGDFETFGIIMAVAIAVEIIVSLCFGWLFDTRGRERMLRASAVIKGIGDLAYAFILKGSVFIIYTFNKVSWNMYRSSYESAVNHRSMNSGNPFLFSTGVNMVLCAVEIVTLSALALIAYFFGMWVFVVVVALSLLGMCLFVRYFAKFE